MSASSRPWNNIELLVICEHRRMLEVLSGGFAHLSVLTEKIKLAEEKKWSVNKYKYNDRGSGIECAHNTSSKSNQLLVLVNVATGEEKSNGTKNFPQNSSNSTFTTGWLDQKQETQEVSSADSWAHGLMNPDVTFR